MEIITPEYDKAVKELLKTHFNEDIDLQDFNKKHAAAEYLKPHWVSIYEPVEPYNDNVEIWRGVVFCHFIGQFKRDIKKMNKKYKVFIIDPPTLTEHDFIGYYGGHESEKRDSLLYAPKFRGSLTN